jgi:riboflavin kinase/FMN adenylyltransferase
MQVFKRLEDIPPEFMGAYVTIGNFDGVHRGHIPIFQRLIQEARQEKRKAVVITFDPHPKKILRPEIRPFYLITTIEEKIDLIEAQGIDAMVIVPFSLEFSKITAEEFIRRILWDKLRIKKIFIGHDYTFGTNREGNESFLKAVGKKLGFEVALINAVRIGGKTVSSTRLRLAILDGDVKTAATLLGRPYNVSGIVVRGKNRGSHLGFPTANIKPDKVLIPARGVYAVMVHFEKSQLQGVLNIGFNPTFADDELSIEVYLFDFRGDIYGERLNILFIDRIRDEVKFDGPERLIEQIKRDINQAKTILNENQKSAPLARDVQRSRKPPAGTQTKTDSSR